MRKQVVDLETMEKISPAFRGKKGHWLAKKVMKLLAIDRVNKVYENSINFTGPDFASALLKDLGVNFQVGNAERLKQLPEGAFITISNHPYGGLDGIMLIDLIASVRPFYKLMVNNVLSLVETLNENFIAVKPVTKTSGSDVSNINGIRTTINHLKVGNPVGFFPSGAVSDFSFKDFRIKDREWQESVIKIIQKAKVPIVPIRFLDGNSLFFYFLGLIGWRVRSLRLPYEVFNKSKQNPRIIIGNTISIETQQQFSDPKSFRAFLRKSVYEMPKPVTFTPDFKLNLKKQQ